MLDKMLHQQTRAKIREIKLKSQEWHIMQPTHTKMHKFGILVIYFWQMLFFPYPPSTKKAMAEIIYEWIFNISCRSTKNMSTEFIRNKWTFFPVSLSKLCPTFSCNLCDKLLRVPDKFCCYSFCSFMSKGWDEPLKTWWPDESSHSAFQWSHSAFSDWPDVPGHWKTWPIRGQ